MIIIKENLCSVPDGKMIIIMIIMIIMIIIMIIMVMNMTMIIKDVWISSVF